MDEVLIVTLEQRLRRTRKAQRILIARLDEAEGDEAARLRGEIEALESIAAQAEAGIYSLLAAMRSGNH